jgi:SAM-dependent methyltransferase
MMLTTTQDPSGGTPGRPARRVADRLSKTVRYYDRHAEAYDAMVAGIDVSDAMSRFTSLLPHAARVLDAGCGGGRDIADLGAQGFSVLGIDISASLARLARCRSGQRVLVGDLRTVALEPKSFDGVWAMASLLHLDKADLPAALGNLHSALKPGGVMFASVKWGEGEVEDDLGRWFTLHDEAGWAGHLRAAGFEVLEIVAESPAAGEAAGKVAPGWISSLARRP